MDLQLKGKVAVVTGGTKGIGRGIANSLAGEGVDLVINYRSNPEDAEKAAQEIRDTYGVEVLLVQGDAGKQETVDAVFDAAMKKFGKVNILINNAGGGGAKTPTDFEELSYEDWKACQDNTLNGQFR